MLYYILHHILYHRLYHILYYLLNYILYNILYHTNWCSNTNWNHNLNRQHRYICWLEPPLVHSTVMKKCPLIPYHVFHVFVFVFRWSPNVLIHFAQQAHFLQWNKLFAWIIFLLLKAISRQRADPHPRLFARILWGSGGTDPTMPRILITVMGILQGCIPNQCSLQLLEGRHCDATRCSDTNWNHNLNGQDGHMCLLVPPQVHSTVMEVSSNSITFFSCICPSVSRIIECVDPLCSDSHSFCNRSSCLSESEFYWQKLFRASSQSTSKNAR